ncbi:PRC-barrel domain-containing protein [Novosphingobium profundi]|uniref:hypothetical protein n=1 Tax=Novosphingobium profundi TaxID=1774954 RepID=UPI001BDAE778|nr:hypothetical protein [Novosphingobium profundi]MBT0667883.1 PRC-barrel domain-containing protein [Novosphingobium profundi]
MFRNARNGLALAPALFAALTVAATASPALAQDGRIARTDVEVAKAMANPHVQMVRNISHRELTPGTPIVESDGTLIGTVEKVVGATITVGDGNDLYEIPIEQLYAYSNGGGEDHFASRLPKARLEPVTRLGG